MPDLRLELLVAFLRLTGLWPALQVMLRCTEEVVRRLENPLSTMFGFMGRQTRQGNTIFKRWQVSPREVCMLIIQQQMPSKYWYDLGRSTSRVSWYLQSSMVKIKKHFSTSSQKCSGTHMLCMPTHQA